jgi:hypothetical protein
LKKHPGLLLFVLPDMGLMLQKFTQKATFNYKQFKPLGKIYVQKRQNEPKELEAFNCQLFPVITNKSESI